MSRTDAERPTGSAAERERLAVVRTGKLADPALLVATVVGLASITLHWAGVVLGGALVGLLASSVRRAVAAGLTFGLLVVVVFGGWATLRGGVALDPTHAAGAVVVAFVAPAGTAVLVRALI